MRHPSRDVLSLVQMELGRVAAGISGMAREAELAVGKQTGDTQGGACPWAAGCLSVCGQTLCVCVSV